MYNHFTRIAPPPPIAAEEIVTPTQSSASARSKARTPSSSDTWDPSKTDASPHEDITKLTGAEAGSDPTLTHDLLDRSREAQWSESPHTLPVVHSVLTTQLEMVATSAQSSPTATHPCCQKRSVNASPPSAEKGQLATSREAPLDSRKTISNRSSQLLVT